jgi:hypothetical protein
MSDVAEIVETKFSLKLKNVKIVLQRVVNNINQSFQTLINAITNKYCAGRRLNDEEEVEGKMFYVTTDKDEGGMFPAFKIKIVRKILNTEEFRIDIIRTYEFNRSSTITTKSDVMNFFHSNMSIFMNISETYDIFEVYFFNLNSKEEVEPRPINTPFVKCLDLLTNDEEYKFVLSATNLCFVSWYSKETMLIYLRELRWHLLCVNNKINFHCQIFSQICNMIQNENSYFIEKLNIGVNSIADLFYAIHEECSNLLRPNFDNKNPNAEQFFTYNGIKYFYGNTVDCFQSLLNMIAKVCFILFIEFLLFLNCCYY